MTGFRTLFYKELLRFWSAAGNRSELHIWSRTNGANQVAPPGARTNDRYLKHRGPVYCTPW